MHKTAAGLVVVLVLAATAARADQAAMQAAAAGAKADYLMLYDGVAKKIQSLGEAIPEDKYTWRPAKDVRSIAEVLNHVDGATYLFTKAAGVPQPADAPKDPEMGPGATAKKEILAALATSLAFGRASAEATTPEQLEQKVDFFGNKISMRQLYLANYGHMSEHLGQLIAYARSVGVVPPWSK